MTITEVQTKFTAKLKQYLDKNPIDTWPYIPLNDGIHILYSIDGPFYFRFSEGQFGILFDYITTNRDERKPRENDVGNVLTPDFQKKFTEMAVQRILFEKQKYKVQSAVTKNIVAKFLGEEL